MMLWGLCPYFDFTVLSHYYPHYIMADLYTPSKIIFFLIIKTKIIDKL